MSLRRRAIAFICDIGQEFFFLHKKCKYARQCKFIYETTVKYIYIFGISVHEAVSGLLRAAVLII